MARLFGFVGNRSDLGARVLELETKPLNVVAKGATLGWGIGFYQAGEVLLRRRPIDERPEIDVAAITKDLRADVLIGHVRAATVGNLRTENTHPFRYRQWLFAHTGTVDGYATLALIDRLRAEQGTSHNGMNLLVTDGEHMVAVHHSATMGYRVIKGRAD